MTRSNALHSFLSSRFLDQISGSSQGQFIVTCGRNLHHIAHLLLQCCFGVLRAPVPLAHAGLICHIWQKRQGIYTSPDNQHGNAIDVHQME